MVMMLFGRILESLVGSEIWGVGLCTFSVLDTWILGVMVLIFFYLSMLSAYGAGGSASLTSRIIPLRLLGRF